MKGRNPAVIKALKHNQASTSLLFWLTLPGIGRQAGEFMQAGHWHCTDLLAGVAAHLRQLCDMIDADVSPGASPSPCSAYIYRSVTTPGLGFISFCGSQGEFPLQEEVCCHCNPCRWKSNALDTCTSNQLNGRLSAKTQPDLTGTTIPCISTRPFTKRPSAHAPSLCCPWRT